MSESSGLKKMNFFSDLSVLNYAITEHGVHVKCKPYQIPDAKRKYVSDEVKKCLS